MPSCSTRWLEVYGKSSKGAQLGSLIVSLSIDSTKHLLRCHSSMRIAFPSTMTIPPPSSFLETIERVLRCLLCTFQARTCVPCIPICCGLLRFIIRSRIKTSPNTKTVYSSAFLRQTYLSQVSLSVDTRTSSLVSISAGRAWLPARPRDNIHQALRRITR